MKLPRPLRSLWQRFHAWLFEPFPDEPEEPKYRPGYSPEARAAAARHDMLMAESARVRAESASLRAERRERRMIDQAAGNPRPLGMLVSDAPRFREAPGFPAVVAALAPDGSLVASADTVTEHDRAVLAELQGTTLEGRGL